jgi:gamma-glutamylcyclotransferase (GGCT)/AIG2-like uncharacterized protein YtfP
VSQLARSTTKSRNPPKDTLNDLLFIYGTLHPDRAPREIAATVRTLQPLGPATIRGKLYDLGPYPGVVLDHPDPGEVPGHLFAVPNPETLALLDAYEDYHPANPEASLFLRVQTTATLPTGATTPTWVYIYNRHP